MPSTVRRSTAANVTAPSQIKKTSSDKNEAKSQSITHGIKPIGQDRSLWRSFKELPQAVVYVWDRDKHDVVWLNVVVLILIQLAALRAVFKYVWVADYRTILLWAFLHFYTGISVTAGMHRLWSHKSYKATLPLRLFMVYGATLIYENSIFVWVRDHRLHHKTSETEADPHNSLRGFFFAHMGWLMVRKRDEVKMAGKDIDMDDIKAEKLLAFQHRFFLPLVLLAQFSVVALPVWAWNEDVWTSLYVQILRVCVCHHITWFINSIAHWEGDYNYDDAIWPVEAILPAVLALGEGWHNFHHRFPSDYRCSDYKAHWLRPFVNLTWVFIDVCLWLGLASKPVQMSDRLVSKTAEARGRKLE